MCVVQTTLFSSWVLNVVTSECLWTFRRSMEPPTPSPTPSFVRFFLLLCVCERARDRRPRCLLKSKKTSDTIHESNGVCGAIASVTDGTNGAESPLLTGPLSHRLDAEIGPAASCPPVRNKRSTSHRPIRRQRKRPVGSSPASTEVHRWQTVFGRKRNSSTASVEPDVAFPGVWRGCERVGDVVERLWPWLEPVRLYRLPSVRVQRSWVAFQRDGPHTHGWEGLLDEFCHLYARPRWWTRMDTGRQCRSRDKDTGTRPLDSSTGASSSDASCQAVSSSASSSAPSRNTPTGTTERAVSISEPDLARSSSFGSARVEPHSQDDDDERVYQAYTPSLECHVHAALMSFLDRYRQPAQLRLQRVGQVVQCASEVPCLRWTLRDGWAEGRIDVVLEWAVPSSSSQETSARRSVAIGIELKHCSMHGWSMVDRIRFARLQTRDEWLSFVPTGRVSRTTDSCVDIETKRVGCMMSSSAPSFSRSPMVGPLRSNYEEGVDQLRSIVPNSISWPLSSLSCADWASQTSKTTGGPITRSCPSPMETPTAPSSGPDGFHRVLVMSVGPYVWWEPVTT